MPKILLFWDDLEIGEIIGIKNRVGDISTDNIYIKLKKTRHHGVSIKSNIKKMFLGDIKLTRIQGDDYYYKFWSIAKNIRYRKSKLINIKLEIIGIPVEVDDALLPGGGADNRGRHLQAR